MWSCYIISTQVALSNYLKARLFIFRSHLKLFTQQTDVDSETLPVESFTSDEERKDVYDAKKAVRERAAFVRRKCIERNRDFQYAHKYIASNDTSNSFAYYPIAKCGWSTWMEIFFANANRSFMLDSPNFQWGWDSPFREAGLTIIASSMNDSIAAYRERFLFVRNPYDRLISAYKDKIQRGNYSYWFKKPCAWLQPGMPHLTFEQFINCIVESARKMDSKSLSSPRVWKIMDAHWAHQYWLALPCSSNYTMIGSFDHMSEDIEAVATILGLSYKNVHRNDGRRLKNETLRYWFRNISESDMEALKSIYEPDFFIFNFGKTLPT